MVARENKRFANGLPGGPNRASSPAPPIPLPTVPALGRSHSFFLGSLRSGSWTSTMWRFLDPSGQYHGADKVSILPPYCPNAGGAKSKPIVGVRSSGGIPVDTPPFLSTFQIRP